jgi:SPP1 family phage portal protein
MVNQKVEISLSNGVEIVFPETTEDGDKNNRNEDLQNQVNNTLGTDFDTLLIKYAKGASNHGLGWVMPYLNIRGEFKLKVINAKEIIPIYSDRDPELLLQVIRYYYRNIKIDGEIKAQLVVEIWGAENFEIWMKDSEGNLNRVSTNRHFQFNVSRNGTVISAEGLGWGRVPFIRLLNNDEETTDLDPIKAMVDDYDLQVSDSSNTIADLADAVWALVNYGGQDLGEFRRNLKQKKVIPLDVDGSATPHTLDIPSEARNSHLKRLKEDIYSLGQGVDTMDSKFGNSPSGIALRLMFADVIMKANSMLRYMESALYNILWFVNKYYEMANERGGELTEFEPKDAKFVFELALPVNTKEIVDMLNTDTLLDQETLIAQHPLRMGQSVEEILKKRAAEQELVELEPEPPSDGDG